MKTPHLLFALALVLFLQSVYAQVVRPADHIPAASYRALPLFFEANRGQTDPRVRFLSRGNGYSLFLTPTETMLVEGKTQLGGRWNSAHSLADSKSLPPAVLRMTLVGANPAPILTGVEELPGKVNYLIGNDPHAWHTGVPLYSQVRSEQVYPGVNLVFHGDERMLEYDFVVSPGADPNRVVFRITGAKQIQLDESGDLVLHTSSSQVLMHKPLIYQPAGAERQPVHGAFVLRANGDVGFELAAYDRSRPLVIDPTISYATFLGGAGIDNGFGVVVDTTTAPNSPKMYVPGVTNDITTFPEASTLIGSSPGGTNYIFLAKIDPKLTGAASLDFLTFIGGSINFSGATGCATVPTGLALDTSLGASSVEIVISGATDCKNYPVTTTTPTTGSDDMFVTRLVPSGSALDLSIFFGGNGQEPPGTGLATVDSSGNVVLASYTTSTNLPVTAGAYATKLNNGAAGFEDCFVAKLSRSFVVEYLTYLNVGAGSVSADAGALACIASQDSSGQILAGGDIISSTAFNAAGGANGFQTAFQGIADTFLMKLNPSLSGTSQLTYASYLGGGGITDPGGAALLAPGVVAIVGNTTSGTTANPGNIPLKNAFLSTNLASASSDKGIGFVTVVDTTKTGAASLICSTYFGGSGGDDKVQALAFDPVPGNTSSYRLVMGGQTTSTNFPTMNPLQSTLTGAQNGWVSVMNVPKSSAGPKASLAFSTYIGGNFGFGPMHQNEAVQGIAVDANHTIYARGRTLSDNFFANTSPATLVNGFQTKCSSCSPTHASPVDDAVVFVLPLPVVTLAPSSLTFAGQLIGTTSLAKNVMLTNSGGVGALTISSISASGDFHETNTCPVSPATLAVGAHCTITVTFTPTVAGAILGEVTVTDSAPSAVQLVNVSGTGKTPLTFSPASLAFGTVTVGTTSAAKTVTLTNNQSTTLNISFSASGDYAAVGSGATPCGTTLAGGKTCTMSVTFSPKNNGSINGAITLTSSSGPSPLLVTLSGTGSGGAAGPLTFSPATLSFTGQVVGTISVAKTVTVTNSSASAVNVTSVTAPGTFLVSPGATNPCPKNLAAGAQCTFTVKFNPSVAGTFKVGMVIADSAPISPQVYNVTGTSVLPVTFSPVNLVFPARSVGTTSPPITVTLTNNQSTTLTLNGIVASGDYTATPGGTTPCGANVAGKGKCTFTVTFSPTATGTIKGVVTVTHNAANSPQLVTLSGTGQ